MKSERRRTTGKTLASAVLDDNTTHDIEIEQDEQGSMNFHGLRYCFSIEPENADANANGIWYVVCLPQGLINSGDLPNTIGEMVDDSDVSKYIWGMGCWTASNQAPFHYEFAPKSSRNCVKGARVRAVIVPNGISAGAVRIIQVLSIFTYAFTYLYFLSSFYLSAYFPLIYSLIL